MTTLDQLNLDDEIYLEVLKERLENQLENVITLLNRENEEAFRKIKQIFQAKTELIIAKRRSEAAAAVITNGYKVRAIIDEYTGPKEDFEKFVNELIREDDRQRDELIRKANDRSLFETYIVKSELDYNSFHRERIQNIRRSLSTINSNFINKIETSDEEFRNILVVEFSESSDIEFAILIRNFLREKAFSDQQSIDQMLLQTEKRSNEILVRTIEYMAVEDFRRQVENLSET